MIFKQENKKKNKLLGSLTLVIILLVFVLPATLDAAQYYVWGRVFAASPLAEGEEVPPNPLTGILDDQVIGDLLVAEIPANLVTVRVVKASDCSELGSFTTTTYGNYFISFNVPGDTISARFIVEDMASGEVVLESEPNVLRRWTVPADEYNVRHLLVLKSLTYISEGREFATTTPGTHTGIFTRVGKVELQTEVSGTTYRLINTSTGRVTVPEVIGSQLAIHRYKDAPLGGNLYMFGAFDQLLYTTPGIHYRIRIYRYDTVSASYVHYKYMDDELWKTKYTVDLSASPPSVTTERLKLGPITVGVTPNCYNLTPLSTSSGFIHEFWSFPDLLALWRTAASSGLNGKYKTVIEVVGLGGGFVPVPDFTDLPVFLDNTAPVAKILPLGPEDAVNPTPRVYIPASAANLPGGCDLISTRLGNWTADYGGTANPICAILDLIKPPAETYMRYLAFKLQASHDSSDGVGYLRYWRFRYKRNDGGYQNHIGKKFDGTSMVDFSPMQFTSTESTTNGFNGKFLYLERQYLEPGVGTTMGSCGYRFVIDVATRTTDGYHYLRYSWDEDIHYIIR